jgi:hypothetical protein
MQLKTGAAWNAQRRKANQESRKNIMKMLASLILTMGLSSFALAQEAPPAQVSPADAKDHVGETVTVCGKVVDTKIAKYGLAGYGKPVLFDLDQPEPDPIFYFVSFGSKEGGPDEVIAAYKGKNVCVSGKVSSTGSKPYIMANDRSKIKVK